jgi:hypothetical protein
VFGAVFSIILFGDTVFSTILFGDTVFSTTALGASVQHYRVQRQCSVLLCSLLPRSKQFLSTHAGYELNHFSISWYKQTRRVPNS